MNIFLLKLCENDNINIRIWPQEFSQSPEKPHTG